MTDTLLKIGSLLLATVALIIALQNDALWLFLMIFFLLWADKLDKHLMAKKAIQMQAEEKRKTSSYIHKIMTDDK